MVGICVSMYYVYENGCCTCYIFVSDSINLVMLMMMEGSERGLAYTIETLTDNRTVGKTKTKIEFHGGFVVVNSVLNTLSTWHLRCSAAR